LRALYALARHYGHGPVLISKLSEEEAIPRKFLELILLDLKNRGVVESKKGKGGGYFLARAPEAITVGSVIRLIDGPLAPLPCASETQFRRCDECHDEKVCGTRMVMKEVRDAIAHILDHTTLADVCRKVDSAREHVPEADPLVYHI
jgi:Rrf2 family protein